MPLTAKLYESWHVTLRKRDKHHSTPHNFLCLVFNFHHLKNLWPQHFVRLLFIGFSLIIGRQLENMKIQWEKVSCSFIGWVWLIRLGEHTKLVMLDLFGPMVFSLSYPPKSSTSVLHKIQIDDCCKRKFCNTLKPLNTSNT